MTERDVARYRLRRDIEIRRLARKGMTREQIAERVFLSVEHVRKIARGAHGLRP